MHLLACSPVSYIGNGNSPKCTWRSLSTAPLQAYETPLTSSTDGSKKDFFFTSVFDKNPLDSPADYRLRMSMKPLNIVLSKPFLDRVGMCVHVTSGIDPFTHICLAPL